MKYLLEIALYEYLAPVKCLFDYKLTKNKFNEMMNEIKMNFIKAIIEPGEMVGVIAAQNIGEPTSQMSQCKSTEIKLIKKKNDIITIKLPSEFGKYIGNINSTKYDNMIYNIEYVNNDDVNNNVINNDDLQYNVPLVIHN